jgi:predicted Zn-dependent protease
MWTSRPVALLFLLKVALAWGVLVADEAQPLSPIQEQVIGKKLREAFLMEHPLTQDGNLLVRVDEIGRRVARFGDRPDLIYHFLVVQGKELQAHSIPGGTICVTESLARLLDDDEMAFILGHELAHITLRHHAFKSKLQDVLDAGPRKTRRLLGELQRSLDQQAEMEADKYGALYMLRADYRYSATHGTLKRMEGAIEEPDREATHPEYPRRIAALEAFRQELERALEAFDLGLGALKADEPSEAINYFNLFVAEFPSNVAGRVNLGASHLARVRSAAGTPENLAEVLPPLPDPGVQLRSGAYDRRDLEFARDHFERAIRVNPDASMGHAGLALVAIRLGDFKEARRALSRARSINPESAEILLCQANVEYLLGDYEAAARLDLETLTLRPEWPAALKNLSLAYERLGRVAEARELWRTLKGYESFRVEALMHLERLKDDREP